MKNKSEEIDKWPRNFHRNLKSSHFEGEASGKDQDAIERGCIRVVGLSFELAFFSHPKNLF